MRRNIFTIIITYKGLIMMNKSLFIIALLAFGSSAHANLQQELEAKCDKINLAKQDARAGKAFAIDKCSSCKGGGGGGNGCSRCNKT